MKRVRASKPEELSETSLDVHGELLSAAYCHLVAVARTCLWREPLDHTFNPATLVAELYLRLARGRLKCTNRAHFYTLCAKVMHHILIDHARALATEKRSAGLALIQASDIPGRAENREDILDLKRALSRLQAIDSRKLRILELRVHFGYTADETAGILKLSRATVERDMKFARRWLCRELRSNVTRAS